MDLSELTARTNALRVAVARARQSDPGSDACADAIADAIAESDAISAALAAIGPLDTESSEPASIRADEPAP